MIKEQLEKNHNVQPNRREIERLKESFPHFFSKEGEFLKDRFETMLKAEEVQINKEGYELNFLGKSYARYLSSTETETVITPFIEENAQDENKTSGNLYIIGDNIDALKHLLFSYSGEVNCIFIDPPYNTGSDGFVYPDNFQFSSPELAKAIGIDEDEAQRILTLAGKSSHSAWLTYMYPRLILGRELLSYNGVIFISIDDNEQANLKLICDEIFGEENFISNIVWRKKTGASDAKGISTITDSILVYIKKDKEQNAEMTFAQNKESFQESRYNKQDEFFDERGPYYTDTLDRGGLQYSDSMNFPITAPDGKILYPNGREHFFNDGWIWKWGESKVKWGIENGYIVIEKSSNKKSGWSVKYKNYLYADNEGNLYERSVAFKNTILEILNTEGTNELNALLGGNYFNNPKPTNLVYTLLKYLNQTELVMDFFSGSATTSHAVMKLNSEDGGNRKYIMVQLPEVIDEKKPAFKAGYRTIDEIGRERIRRAAKKIKEETGAEIDYGFKTFRLETPKEDTLDEIETFDPSAKLLPYDMVSLFETDRCRGKDTILTTWLNQDGYGLNSMPTPLKLASYYADRCDNSLYIIEEGITSEDVMELVKELETMTLDIDRVVVYPYSLPFHVMHELKNNIKTLRNNKNVELIERY